MLRVGLTGGIGAGKSTVSTRLAELGATIVDADKIAREVVEPGTPGLAELVDAFGTEILTSEGTLDRPALAAVAFSDDQSRATLNSIVHPRVGARTGEIIAAAPPDGILVHDIPLLIENGLAPTCHLVLVVHAEEDQRVHRLTSSRGMPETDARARIAAQATDEQRRAAADIWLDNTQDREHLLQQVAAAWHDRLVPFEHNLRTRAPVPVPVTPSEPDPRWAEQAARLVARLRLACGGTGAAVEHVGPTSVPGVPAPDSIDIQIAVADQGEADELADRLADAGFPATDTASTGTAGSGAAGVDDDVLARHANADPGRPATVHLQRAGTPGQRLAITLRDWLRSDDAARAEYADRLQRSANGDRAALEAWLEQARARLS
ncbi:dephospho-CoA kinase [Lolliginicoccus levis]|uniref:dephospho-CoA kinase n=1 Tax=Lolliginicoccus levis TaxID=2919542 RepID=UPI0024201E40|nr:dephospho-CoA kinase [Lolliginicoccus levis]